MPLYLDADAVVRRYIDEGDGATAVMDAIFADPDAWGGLSSSEWLLPEVTAALAKKRRTGALNASRFAALLADFRAEVADLVTAIEFRGGEGARWAALIVRFARTRFHAGDAVHLLAAEELRRTLEPETPFVLVSADQGFGTVARLRGIPTFDPATQPLSDLRAALEN